MNHIAREAAISRENVCFGPAMVLSRESTINLRKFISVSRHRLDFIIGPEESPMVDLDLCTDLAIAGLDARLVKVNVFIASVVSWMEKLWTLDPCTPFCDGISKET